jgi:hypothetical protein
MVTNIGLLHNIKNGGVMMKNVVFTPYVGKNYFEHGYKNKKIMILGESHYCKKCERKGKKCWATNKKKCNERKYHINLFLKYKNGKGESEKWFNTFTKFTKIFTSSNNVEDINNFWNSIIFYNYVQTRIKKPRKKPTPEMLENSVKPFFEILKKYEPDVIFVWGSRLWNYLPSERYIDGKTISNKPRGFYKNGTRNIPVFYINHPSSGFNIKYWSKYIKKAMSLI